MAKHKWEDVPAGVACWHIHHDHPLVEFTTEPLINRIAFIQVFKPGHQQATRLRLLAPVQGPLPAAVVEAGEACCKAEVACDKARLACGKARLPAFKAGETFHKAGVACDKATRSYLAAVDTHLDEINALHRKECPDCPWDGETIFPEAQ